MMAFVFNTIVYTPVVVTAAVLFGVPIYNVITIKVR